MPPHLLTNFEIQNYNQNEPTFNGVYSRNNLPKIKDRAFVIKLNEFKSIRTHWIDLYMFAENVAYLDSFGVEYIPKKFRKFTENKNITTNIYSIEAYNSIICGYFCIGFIDFMLKGKSILEYKNSFSPNEYKKNEKIILKYFQ